MHTGQADNTSPEGVQREYGHLVGRSSKASPKKPAVAKHPDPGFYTTADHVVLEELFDDINRVESNGITKDSKTQSRISLNQLSDLNDAKSENFQPTVFSNWDYNFADLEKAKDIKGSILNWYIAWAITVVRHDTDVVFLTHILLYLSTSVPSAIFLFYRFNYFHAITHLVLTVWFTSSFTLLLHNHIHNNGVLSKKYSLFDFIFPYILEPLMGHTWDSYYYHHVKHHHVEGNGPDDLSSTLRYQRDSVIDFLAYEARFLVLCWAELPLYFIRKGKYALAFKSGFSELSSYTFLYLMASWKFRPALFVLILPFCLLRLVLMIGNWGQHALVDEADPNSDMRSSITLIDVPSNRFCFNDGYHTSHHLNPRRHWREHPQAFLKAKDRYSSEGALVFHNIDYLGITFCLLTKNYKHLAKQLVPIGSQIGMTQDDLVAMLKTKTRRFTEEEIAIKFKSKALPRSASREVYMQYQQKARATQNVHSSSAVSVHT